MKLAKSLLLGSAAGLVAVAGAQAADLPVRAAAPVDFVRVCPAQGTGFFFIPGTETCLRIGGNVRAEYRFDERLSRDVPATSPNATRNQNDWSFFARATMVMDARTATEFGTLRSFAQIFFNSQDTAGTVTVDRAFIQFAGLTAGRYTSFFDFWGGGLLRGGLQGDAGVEGLAYTATFGSGFSATVSVEGPRRAVGAEALALYGGRNLPALVGNVRVDQAWGAAQLSGALNQIRVNQTLREAGINDRTGWAINAGVNIRLPMLASGSQLWLNATYADGAIAYANLGGTAQSRLFQVGPYQDAYVTTEGTLRTTKAWLLSGAIRHFWTPQVYSHLQGSFGKIDAPSNTLVRDVDFWQIGKTIGWTPVRDLLIAGEVSYTEARLQRFVNEPDFRRTSGRWGATLRIQRDF